MHATQHYCKNPASQALPPASADEGAAAPQGGLPRTVTAFLRRPPTCSGLAFRLGSGKPEHEAITRLRGGNRAMLGLSNWTRTHHCRHPTTSASSETGRFPVVSAPFPSATLYCKQRATLNKAPRCPVSGWGGGEEADGLVLQREALPRLDPL